MWSPPTSSRGTSPALSFTSRPTSHIDNYQFQPHARADEYIAQPIHQFLTPQPASIPRTPPEPAPYTLLAQGTETPFLRMQQPATIPEPVPVPPLVIKRPAAPAPQTPFLRKLQPNWPPPNTSPAPPMPQPAAAATEDWPPKQRPRPQTHLFIQAYRPATTTAAPSSASDTKGELSDAALWQALGGGRFVAPARSPAASNYNAANTYNSDSNSSLYAHGHGHRRVQSHGAGQVFSAHPDYPHMSPYDVGEKGESDGGLGQGLRVSMPPPARAGEGMASLSGPFVARLD
jgi:hypothetical protein